MNTRDIITLSGVLAGIITYITTQILADKSRRLALKKETYMDTWAKWKLLEQSLRSLPVRVMLAMDNTPPTRDWPPRDPMASQVESAARVVRVREAIKLESDRAWDPALISTEMMRVAAPSALLAPLRSVEKAIEAAGSLFVKSTRMATLNGNDLHRARVEFLIECTHLATQFQKSTIDAKVLMREALENGPNPMWRCLVEFFTDFKLAMPVAEFRQVLIQELEDQERTDARELAKL